MIKRHNTIRITYAFLSVVLFVHTEHCQAASDGSADYLAVVRGYADAMIEHGRDHYGEQSSPLFASFLKLEPAIERIGEHEEKL
jgi:hypothetical protein